MTGTVDYSTHYQFRLPTIDKRYWQDNMNDNWRMLDALLYEFIGANNLIGVWKNSTAYTSGQGLVDATEGRLYTCAVDHVSAASPTTFAEDRAAHPSYWTSTTNPGNLFVGTSTTSLTVGTGSKVLTTQANWGWAIGMYVNVYRTSDLNTFMIGQVTAYDRSAGVLTVDVTNTLGSGTFADWTIVIGGSVIAGPTGATGPAGPVSFVGLSMPTQFAVTNSPVTTSGTLTVAWNQQTANYIFAGPPSGGNDYPTFRPLVAADVPVFAASGASHASGTVPDPGAVAGTTKFLREDATWQVPPNFDISSLTEDTAPDISADFVPTYDISATANKKILLHRLRNVTRRTSATPGSDTLALSDKGNWVEYTGGTSGTPTFTAAATLGDKWSCIVKNAGTGVVTLDPNAAETIDGLTSFKMYPNEARLIVCNGLNFFSIVLCPFYVSFTANDTFVVPPGYGTLFAECFGSGGGGGGGRGGAAASIRNGGSGGGAGERKRGGPWVAPAAGTNISITVGAIGTSGAGGSSGNGSNGGDGNASSFGSYISAAGGKKGVLGDNGTASINGGNGGGTATQPVALTTPDASSALGPYIAVGGSGTTGGNGELGGGGGGSSGASGNNIFDGGSSQWSAGGGGSGGGVTSGNAAKNGGVGGASGSYAAGGGGAAGSGGASTNPGTTGAAGTNGLAGAGGGGGGGNTAGTGGAGGNGGAPGGGGGGGGAGTTTGGAGGTGGLGQVNVWGA
jgi:hypothetical protein